MTTPQKLACDLVIRNAHIVTMDADAPEHSRGALAIAGSRIAAVGSESDVLAAYEGRNTIDARGGLVHPGMIDTHVHVTTTIMRTLIPENSVASASDLANAVGEYFDCVTSEQENRATLLTCCEYLLAGYTMVVDPGTIGDTEAAASAMREVGIRALVGEPFLQDRDRGQISTKRFAATRERCESVLGSELWRNREQDGLVKGQIALYGLGTATTDLVRMAVRKAREASATLTMHESFVSADLEDRPDLEGQHPFVHWGRTGLLDELGERFNFAHCNVVHDDEVAPVSKARSTLTWCPHNLLYYGIQNDVVRPMTQLFRQGANVTLGHDFVKCFQGGDEPLFAYVVSHMWGDALLPADLLRMSTANAARTVGMGGEIGALKPGYRADIVIRSDAVLENLPPRDALKSALLVARSKSIDTVIVDGTIRVRHGKLVSLDLGEVRSRVERAAADIARTLKL